jgi:hypothetical protein
MLRTEPRLYSLHIQHDPWRASGRAWRPVVTTMASSMRCSPSISFKLGDLLLALGEGTGSRNSINLGH